MLEHKQDYNYNYMVTNFKGKRRFEFEDLLFKFTLLLLN